jgi:hypothetical protein
MPSPEASQAPIVCGIWEGTTSAIRVGRDDTLFANHCQSSRKSCTCLCNRKRFFSLSGWRKASCRVLNKPLPPGIANAMDRNSPRVLCYELTATRRWPGCTLFSISLRRAIRWGGSSTVPLIVSMIHPKIAFLVAYVASPWRSFLREAGSWR